MHTSNRLLSLSRAPQGARRAGRRAGLLAVALALGSLPFGSACTKVQSDNSSSYLIVDSMLAAPGASPGAFANVLFSDVLTCVKKTGELKGYCAADFTPTTFVDLGKVEFKLGMKDASITTPTSANFITVTSYHVDFARSDGGAGGATSFDSAANFTVNGTGGSGSFLLVPLVQKGQLGALLSEFGGTAIEVKLVATVTFFGKDQAGRNVQVATTIGIDFSDWADPA